MKRCHYTLTVKYKDGSVYTKERFSPDWEQSRFSIKCDATHKWRFEEEKIDTIEIIERDLSNDSMQVIEFYKPNGGTE